MNLTVASPFFIAPQLPLPINCEPLASLQPELQSFKTYEGIELLVEDDFRNVKEIGLFNPKACRYEKVSKEIFYQLWKIGLTEEKLNRIFDATVHYGTQAKPVSVESLVTSIKAHLNRIHEPAKERGERFWSIIESSNDSRYHYLNARVFGCSGNPQGVGPHALMLTTPTLERFSARSIPPMFDWVGSLLNHFKSVCIKRFDTMTDLCKKVSQYGSQKLKFLVIGGHGTHQHLMTSRDSAKWIPFSSPIPPECLGALQPSADVVLNTCFSAELAERFADALPEDTSIIAPEGEVYCPVRMQNGSYSLITDEKGIRQLRGKISKND
ncbi:MAG: hypothetical protein COT85_07330 [Chlamydiae bacterium CG10_big_fil_rev_8_21_14_0_10_42_34]|nr:MAG: hypothetical protein COT85_07330 [Chlamydiae bacterium CG10_big_fil_rev_8_21_14_0_10_42_34]